MNSLTKIAVGLALLLGMTSAGAGQVEHQRNEARAVVDEETGLARLDVYDSFFVKEAEPKELASAVNLAVVDGFRQIAPTCADAQNCPDSVREWANSELTRVRGLLAVDHS